ncbi:MAG: hypothetical protein WC521_09000 [Bdellovibrionales bacterium]|jgi:hypothetical protein
MRISFVILLAACLLAATSSDAGNLTLENNQPIWHSAKCVRPAPPESILNADPETSGEKMNAMILDYNAYVHAAQAYMTCVSRESENDQMNIGQAITLGAKDEITSILNESEKLAAPLRGKK